ncbi:MAG: TlpA family protein disulfide reductase [Candidatus Dormibacteria bacterium]
MSEQAVTPPTAKPVLPGPAGPRRTAAVVAAFVAVLLTAGVIIVTRGDAGGTSTTPGGVTISTDPSTWQLPALRGGGAVRLSDFRGTPVVVNFFASWCSECRGELPLFARVATDLRGRVRFVGVNSLETGDGLAMARQFHIDNWPLASDSGGANSSGLHDALGGQGMPLTAFYDATGKLLSVHLGAFNERDLRAALRAYAGVP